MVQNIRLQFKSILSQVSWMDDLSRNAAQEKVDSIIIIFLIFAVYKGQFVLKADRMDVKIGYPDYTYNDTYMNDRYKGVSLKKITKNY
jgi:predicted metalloendopeptidase